MQRLQEIRSNVAQGQRSPTPPTAPPTLPQYIADGLPKQDDKTLRDTHEYIDQLLADRERRREEPVTEDELPKDADVVDEGSSGTVSREYRTCGDDTCKYMTGGGKHGLYKYRAYRDGDTVRRENLGKADSEWAQENDERPTRSIAGDAFDLIEFFLLEP